MGVDIIRGGGSESSSVSTEVKTVSRSTNSIESNSNVKQKIVQNSAPVKNKKQESGSEKEQSANNVQEQLKEWTSKMNMTINEKVKFAYSEDFGGIYVTVIDDTTKEVIRKIPTEDAIKLSAIWKEAVGNIFDRKG